jgi:NAD dependent epimerase/dehydratase
MSKKSIFVTGADGFIGSHLVETLVKNNYKVKALCLYNSFGHKGWLDTIDTQIKKEIEFVLGDIRDQHCILSATKDIEIIYHLASLIAIPYSYSAPQSYIDTNITGTFNVLQAAKLNEIEQIMHTSTSEVYGTAQYVPIDEKHPLVGQSPYSASKIGADQIAISFQRSFNTPVSIMRPFNTYGPKQSMRAVIPTIIKQLLSGVTKIKLGNIYATRDFNYVKDIVNGMIAFMGNQNSIGKVINLGSNFEVSIKETAILIANILDVKLEFDIEQERIRPENSEVERLWADNRLAKEILNWQPEYANINGFKKGLTETIEWFRKNSDVFLYNAEVNKYAI